MAAKTPMSMLEEEERQARVRLGSYRAKLHTRSAASPMAADIRLRELERKWKGADERLRCARKGVSSQAQRGELT
jgi:hypothetical protein